MLIYKKYISKNILPTFIMLTVLLTSLVWITQTLRMVHLIDKGIELSYFLKLIIFIIPSLLFIILPIISVLAVIYTYNNLQNERQLIVLKASGLNNYDIIKPALMIASIVTIIAYFISFHLMPVSYNAMKQKLSDFNRGYVSNIINDRTFNQISKYSNIYVDHKNTDGSLEGIILFDSKIPQNRTILFAKNAKIIASDIYSTEFELTSGMRHSYDKYGKLTKLYFDHLIVAINNNDRAEQNERNRTSLELFLDEMLWPNKELPIKKQKQLIIDGHLRIIWPLFNFAFIFLALSLFLSQPYTRKTKLKQFIITFLPILLVTYFHFTIQKMAYKEFDYIFLCYANVFFCIIFSLWHSHRKTL